MYVLSKMRKWEELKSFFCYQSAIVTELVKKALFDNWHLLKYHENWKYERDKKGVLWIYLFILLRVKWK